MFDYGKPVTGERFYDRSALRKEIGAYIEDGVDFMIKAPRRYGKTSLVLQALEGRPRIYLDFRRVPRLAMIPEELLDQAYAIAGVEGFLARAKENAVRLVREARLKAKIDLSLVEFGAEIVMEAQKADSGCEQLVKALDAVERIGDSLGVKVPIVFDEFQDIVKLRCEDNDVLEVLRGTLQHKAHIHSIFLGSIESIMTRIFENKRSPFFNYCRKFSLEPFDIGELQKELTEAFARKGIYFESEEAFRHLLEKLGGHPANTMQAMQSLYYLILENDVRLVKRQHLKAAYERAYYEQLDLIEQYVTEMKGRKHFYDVMFRMARGEKQTLSPQALYQVKKGLLEMGFLVQKGPREYRIADSFLEAYMRDGGKY
jgi:AAA+ ATPase superfamily predicted ATPase